MADTQLGALDYMANPGALAQLLQSPQQQSQPDAMSYMADPRAALIQALSGGSAQPQQAQPQQAAPPVDAMGFMGNPYGSLAQMLQSSQGPAADSNAGGAPSPMGPLSVNYQPPAMPQPPDFNSIPAFRGLGPSGSAGNVAAPTPQQPAAAPTDQTQAMVQPTGMQPGAASPRDLFSGQNPTYQTGLDRMAMGDQTIANAYNQPLPQYQGPQYGLKDLLMGGLPLLALALDRRPGHGASALSFLSGYLGGKQTQAQGQYGRQMTQFEHQEASQVALGQRQSQEGQRLVQAGEMAGRYQLMDQDKAMSQIHYLTGTMDSKNTPPAAIPQIAAELNSIATRAGLPSMVMSPDAIKGYVDSRNATIKEATQVDNARKNWAILNNPKSTAADIKMAGASLLNVMNLRDANNNPMYQPINDTYGGATTQIQQAMQQVPAFEQAEIATSKQKAALTMFQTAAAVNKDAATETINAIRQPTIDSIRAGTGLKDAQTDVANVLAQKHGIEVQYLPKQLQANVAKTYAQVDLADANYNKTLSLTDKIDAQVNSAGQPTPSTVARLQGMANARTAILDGSEAATRSLIHSLQAEQATISDGTMPIPAGTDAATMSAALKVKLDQATAKIQGIKAERAQIQQNVLDYTQRASQASISSQLSNPGAAIAPVNPLAGPIGSLPNPGGPWPQNPGQRSTIAPPRPGVSAPPVVTGQRPGGKYGIQKIG